MEINKLIENLVFYGKAKLQLGLEDSVYARNQLLELFQVEPCEESGEEVDNFQTDILNPLVEYAISSGLAEEGAEIRFETKVMGIIMPSNGLVVQNFNDLYSNEGVESATEYLYSLSVNSNYIRMADVRKNICWYAEGEKGDIGITINLSKPEKDAKQVLYEKNFKGKKYPKCMLCLENLGFFGTPSHPARQTLRVVPITLGGEKWHMQYSPYVYYDEHCIAFSDEHRPMKITDRTFARLLDFVDIFPDYFIGSNADLPIVGGSILSHDHYQGGKKVLPMLERPFAKIYAKTEHATIGIKSWYNSVVTIKGTKTAVMELSCKLLQLWRGYSDEKLGIFSETEGEKHNTITPIATKSGEEYCMDIILRNNRTDDKHPFGIYHPTEDMHNIKKEGIGLIEAMGLFILPGRLKREIVSIIELLGKEQIDFEAVNADEALSKHLGMIAQISANFGMKQSKQDARNNIIKQIDHICLKILDCTAVFKNNKEGQKGFDNFMEALLK